MPQAHAAYAQYAKATKTAKHAAVLWCLCVCSCVLLCSCARCKACAAGEINLIRNETQNESSDKMAKNHLRLRLRLQRQCILGRSEGIIKQLLLSS